MVFDFQLLFWHYAEDEQVCATSFPTRIVRAVYTGEWSVTMDAVMRAQNFA